MSRAFVNLQKIFSLKLALTLITLEHIRATFDKLPRLPEFQVTVFHVT